MRQGRNSRGGHSGGRGRGGHGGGHGGRRGGGGGRGRGRGPRRFERGTAQSGNQRERITIESGFLVLVDQFMLANPEFIAKLNTLMDAAPEEKDAVIREYGGQVIELEPGTYRIERDPYAFSIVIHPEGFTAQDREITRDNTTQSGYVFVDTRCLAMIDRELLDDSGLLDKYQQLWFSGQDKACRDLIRDNGGAVRYGFQRHGDELGIYVSQEDQVVCLWPDLVEGAPASEEAEAAPANA